MTKKQTGEARRVRGNTFMTFLAILLMTTVYSLASDVRVVNNRSVDLTPLHEWMLHPKGDRPLQHWRMIHVISFSAASAASFQACDIEVDGEKKSVYLKNLPPSINAFLAEQSDLQHREETLRQSVVDETTRLRGEDVAVQEAGFYSQLAIDHEAAVARLHNNQDELKELENKVSEYKDEGIKATEELAMFTGQIYANKEVWDCGRKTR